MEVMNDAGMKGYLGSIIGPSVPKFEASLLTTAICIWNPQGAGSVGGSDPPRDGRGWLGRVAAVSSHSLPVAHHPVGPNWSP